MWTGQKQGITDGEMDGQVDVVVVGAGYAGLAAALRLKDEGIDFVVLEASGRVGGRVLSEVREGGAVVDQGGQWVGPTQKNLLALAERFGCETFPSWEEGRHIEVWRDGSRVAYDGAAPEAGPGIDDYCRVTTLLDAMAKSVDLDQPWLTPDFELWDSQTAESFFRAQTGDEDAIRRLALAIQGVWSCEPREISLFHVVFYIAAADGYEQLMETRDCAQDSRFHGGAAAPATALAVELGDRLCLNTPVEAVEQDEQGAMVRTGSGVIRARRVVVALPPPATSGISFTPTLSISRRGWLAHSPMGRVAKVHAVYTQPFWRAAGLSGIATVYDDGPVGVVFDNSPADASMGILVGFVYGDRVSDWAERPAAERRAAVLETLAAIAGPQATDPVDYTEKIWPYDEFAQGGYEAYVTPGGWTGYARDGWRTPSGVIHWAGTETAGRWNGYIDGAIGSGYRAADEVLAAMVDAR
ncbi:flavin monoamine oxidase family protein [Specibacter cremeus]|uniref:flavin monoamine oxidase family protein n=1 Tax=Specibacter cremeus TaxID=1629051 RepID=UPI000F79A80B|nr:FAD-dependent oxidoreductase [Specibacter cremeus]